MRFHGSRAAPGEACVLLKRAQAGGADETRESTRDVRVILLQGSVEVDGRWDGKHFQATAGSARGGPSVIEALNDPTLVPPAPVRVYCPGRNEQLLLWPGVLSV